MIMTIPRQQVPQWALYLIILVPVAIRIFRYYKQRKTKQSETQSK